MMTRPVLDNRGADHPDGETLRRFAHGRLESKAMGDVERHMGGCDSCCRFVQSVPDDALAAILRRREAIALVLALFAYPALPGCSSEKEPLRAGDPDRSRQAKFKRTEVPGRPPGRPNTTVARDR